MSMQPSFRPSVEPLEQRDLPATGIQAYVSAGNLYVVGTATSDIIQVNESNFQLSVTGVPITVNNARVNTIPSASIAKVYVYGNGGDDSIDLSTVRKDAVINGGDGDDRIRCGLGNDTVNASAGFDRVYRPFVANQPVVNGLAVTDVRQGQNPLCQTDAAIAEAVNEGIDLVGAIHYLGNSIYDVKLPGNTADQKVSFNGWTTPDDPAVTNGEFWPVLMQRARLQSLGIDPTVPHSQDQWNQLNQKSNGQLYSINDAVSYFTGNPSNYQTAASLKPQTLQASLAHGDAIVAQSQGNTYVSADGVIGNHTYAVLAVYNDAGTWKVRLYNPWGMDRENGATVDAADKSHAPANDGVITLTWAQFTSGANFKGVVVAARR